MSFLVLTIMILMAVVQTPSLVKQKQWPDLTAFAVVWVAATLYAILITAGVAIPTPTEVLRPVIAAIYRLMGLEVTL